MYDRLYTLVRALSMLAGLCVGVSETLVGYPFLTAKVRYQNGQRLPRSLSGYYRGVRYPLCGSMAFNTVAFGVHDRTQSVLGHGGAGVLSGVLVTPQVFCVDTLAVTRQTNQTVRWELLTRPKGLPMTLARETVALSVYFESYFRAREHVSSVWAGGFAGLCNWTMSYPLDVLRTRQMAQRVSAREALSQGSLWRGFGVVAARAVLVNAVSFTVYEKVLYT